MKRVNFNIKDRKILSIFLCLIIISVFTLTIAYAALSAVLTISGNADVVASTWDIHLENPKVKSGSATTTVPTITSGKSLTFSTTLNMPGDYYEFTVDVVNGGSIDAMIERVTKTPELTADQAKYLKYEVSYANGQSIDSKQNIASGVSMPIKVRVEYRRDLNNGDLPTGQVQLTLGLVLDYIQSDGTGSSVTNNGVIPISANGDINTVGTIVTIGSEQFYTIGIEGNNVKLFAMYNLYVGGTYNSSTNSWTAYGDEATGKQDSTMLGHKSGEPLYRGTTAFTEDDKVIDHNTVYSGSIVENYINNYKTIIEGYGVSVEEARVINSSELTDEETFGCVLYDKCSDKYPWIYSTSYWSDPYMYTYINYISLSNSYRNYKYSTNSSYGVRPVIVISQDYF